MSSGGEYPILMGCWPHRRLHRPDPHAHPRRQTSLVLSEARESQTPHSHLRVGAENEEIEE